MLCHGCDELAPLRFRAGHDFDGQILREFLAFGGPVVYQGRRADDQRGTTALASFHQRQQLHGFAQTHFVGENATETFVPQGGKPLEALHLVRTQHVFEIAGYFISLRIDDFHIVDIVDERFAFAVVINLSIQEERPISGNGDSSGIKLFLIKVKICGNLIKFMQIGILQINERTVLESMVAAVPAVGIQQRADLVHRHFVGYRRNLNQIRVDGQSDLHRRAAWHHHAVERGCGVHLPDRTQDIHAFGEQEQNSLFVFLTNPRHVNGTPCREKLANHLHRE